MGPEKGTGAGPGVGEVSKLIKISLCEFFFDFPMLTSYLFHFVHGLLFRLQYLVCEYIVLCENLPGGPGRKKIPFIRKHSILLEIHFRQFIQVT